MWTPSEVAMLKDIIVGVLALAVVVGLIGGWVYWTNRQEGHDTFADTYNDDYFSDIQDAINDDEDGQVEGQQKLWETGAMPVIEDDPREQAFVRPLPPVHTPIRSDVPVFPASSGGVPYGYVDPAAVGAVAPWDRPANQYAELEAALAGLRQALEPLPNTEAVSSMEQAETSVSVAPGAVQEDFTGQFTFDLHRAEHPDLYLSSDEYMAKQEADRLAWRKEVGLDD